MGRVLHIRIHRIADDDRAALLARFAEVGAGREWRDGTPWLAHAGSTDLFGMEYFRHASIAAALEDPDLGPLGAASFVRLLGDETDALAVLFMLRDVSERFDAHASLRDPDNPIAKLRAIDIDGGRLPSGGPIEDILVRRPVFKKLPDGFRIEMYPPRALGSAFGTVDEVDKERRTWSFMLHGMRGSEPSFLEAEAEAMRIYRGLRFLH